MILPVTVTFICGGLKLAVIQRKLFGDKFHRKKKLNKIVMLGASSIGTSISKSTICGWKIISNVDKCVEL